MYLPDTISSIIKERETSHTFQATDAVPVMTEVQINRQAFDSEVLFCRRGCVLQWVAVKK